MADTIKDEFTGKKSGQESAKDAPEVPERIKNQAPEPVLKPEGGWRARADPLDRGINEGIEAHKAKKEWTKKLNRSLRHGKGFNRRARG